MAEIDGGVGNEQSEKNNGIRPPSIPEAATLPDQNPQPATQAQRTKIKRTPRPPQTFSERWRRMSLPNKLMFFATVIIAVAAILNLVIVIIQIKGNSIQTDKIIAADERIAAAMENDLTQARASLNATIDQNRLDQRAWIGVVKLNSFEFKPGPDFAVPFDITNTGKTPALKVTTEVSLKTLEKGNRFIPTFPAYPRPPKPSSSVIQPQMHMTLSTLPVDVSAAQYGDIQNGRGILYAYGRITYADIFGKSHETTFCVMYWAGLSAPIQCDIYNSAD